MALRKASRDWFEGQVDLETPDLEARRDYIKSVVDIAADDARNVLLTAAVGVAVVLFLLKDSLSAVQLLGQPYTTVCALAVFALLGGSGLLLWYAAEINRRRMLLARCLANSDAVKARAIWAGREGISNQRGHLLSWGMRAIGVGIVASAVVVLGLLGIL